MLLGIGIIVIILLIGVCILASFEFSLDNKNMNTKVAKYGALIFICGLLLHFGGVRYNEHVQPTDTLWLIHFINIIIRAVKMFAWDFNSDILAAAMANNNVFAIGVFATFILAQASILYFLLVVFNVLIINNLKILRNKRKSHFVIIANSRYSEYFIDDLKENKYKYITIITNEETDEVRKKWLAKGVAVVNKKLSFEALTSAGIISRKEKVIVVSLLENDDENLNAGILITNYIKTKLTENEKLTEGELKDKIKQLNLVCTIQYKNIDRSEHFRFAQTLCGKMRFFNMYDLMARDFIIKYPITSILPLECFDYDRAKLKKDTKIVNIFVGFGKTNREMLIKNLCNNQMLGHDYNAIVYDYNIQDKQTEFQKHASGIFEDFIDSPDYFKSPLEKYKIRFSVCNVLSKTFYDEIESIVKENTFVQIIISLGSDSFNLETALELRQSIKEIDCLGKVKIFSFQKYDNYSIDNLKSLNIGYDEKNYINFIGNEKSVFTHDVLINEKLDDVAKRIAESYEEASRAKMSVAEAWNNLSIFSQESNRLAAYGIRIKLNLIGLDIVENVDEGISEAEYFKHYKISKEELDLLAALENKENKDKYLQVFLKDKFNNFEDTPRNNLAKLEHLRWNTVHLVNGWSKYPKSKLHIIRKEKFNQKENKFDINYNIIRKDESIKKHACITTFAGLDDLTKKSQELYEQIDISDALKLNQSKEDYIMKQSETIRYDYTVMDNLFKKIIANSTYRIVKISKKNK